MATVIDALVITLGLDSKNAERDLEQARGKLQNGAKGIASAIAAPLAAAAAGLFSVGAALTQYTEQAASLDRLSASLGLSIERLQEWQFAAESAGAEAQEFGNFFRDISDYIVDATEFDSGPLKEIGKALGISLKDMQGNVKKTETVILELADAFQKVGSQKAVAFGMQMGIDPAMIGLLQKGRAELERLFAIQRELGSYTKEDAELVHRFNFALLTMRRSVEAAAMPFVRAIIPAITSMAEAFAKAAAWVRRHSQFISIAFGLIATAATATLAPALWGLAKAATAAALPFAPFIAVVGGAALIIDDLISYINGGESALSGFWAIFGTGEEIAKGLADAWQGLKEVGVALWGGLKIAAQGFFDAVTGWAKGLLDWLEPILDDFRKLGEFIGKIIPDMPKLPSFEEAPDGDDLALQGVSPAAYAASGGTTSTVTQTTTINGGINVTTQATDAEGTAKAVSRALQKRTNTTANADSGVNW